MIKKIKSIFKEYMIRPLLYKTVTKASIVLVIALLWDRFINTSDAMSLTEDVFFILGLIFMLFSWFQYLKLDGFSIHHLLEEREKKRKTKNHVQKDIVDFVDEKIVSFAELEDDEKTVVVLFSNLISGFIFLAISLITLIL